MIRNPMQPFEVDSDGEVRFRANAIVRALVDHGRSTGMDLNAICSMDFSQDDFEQFYQLIGYSLNGYHELSFVSDESAMAATVEAHKQVLEESVGYQYYGCRDTGCKIHCGVERRER